MPKEEEGLPGSSNCQYSRALDNVGDLAAVMHETIHTGGDIREFLGPSLERHLSDRH